MDTEFESLNQMLPDGETKLSSFIKKCSIFENPKGESRRDFEIETLLKAGCSANGLTPNGLPQSIPLTAINYKVGEIQDACDFINMLLSYGVDINGEDVYARTALTQACYANNETIIEYLLKRGSNPNGTVFHNPYYILTVIHNRPITDRIVNLLVVYGANSRSFYRLIDNGVVMMNVNVHKIKETR